MNRLIITGNNATMSTDAAQQAWAAYRSRINDWVNAPIGLPTISTQTKCPTCRGLRSIWTSNGNGSDCEPCPKCGG
jgi:hypothetical protein